MRKGQTVKLKIDAGEVNVAHAYIYTYTDSIVALAVDLSTSYAKIYTTGTDGRFPEVCLGLEDLHFPLDWKPTVITFPEFDMYDIWSAQIDKNTLHICLINKLQKNQQLVLSGMEDMVSEKDL